MASAAAAAGKRRQLWPRRKHFVCGAGAGSLWHIVVVVFFFVAFKEQLPDSPPLPSISHSTSTSLSLTPTLPLSIPPLSLLPPSPTLVPLQFKPKSTWGAVDRQQQQRQRLARPRHNRCHSLWHVAAVQRRLCLALHVHQKYGANKPSSLVFFLDFSTLSAQKCRKKIIIYDRGVCRLPPTTHCSTHYPATLHCPPPTQHTNSNWTCFLNLIRPKASESCAKQIKLINIIIKPKRLTNVHV